jgi:hypothetical protein
MKSVSLSQLQQLEEEAKKASELLESAHLTVPDDKPQVDCGDWKLSNNHTVMVNQTRHLAIPLFGILKMEILDSLRVKVYYVDGSHEVFYDKQLWNFYTEVL